MHEVTARYARLDRIHIETRSSLQGPSLLSSELVSIIFSHFSDRPDILFGCFSPQDYYRTHHDHYAQVTSNIKNVEDGQCDSQSHYRKGPDYPFNSQEYSRIEVYQPYGFHTYYPGRKQEEPTSVLAFLCQCIRGRYYPV